MSAPPLWRCTASVLHPHLAFHVKATWPQQRPPTWPLRENFFPSPLPTLRTLRTLRSRYEDAPPHTHAPPRTLACTPCAQCQTQDGSEETLTRLDRFRPLAPSVPNRAAPSPGQQRQRGASGGNTPNTARRLGVWPAPRLTNRLIGLSRRPSPAQQLCPLDIADLSELGRVARSTDAPPPPWLKPAAPSRTRRRGRISRSL